MHDAIVAFPGHLRESVRLATAVDWSAYKPTTPQGICICGMGGSAIGGDLARSYWESESPIPIIVVRNDRLPAYVNDHWFVIASSYSGDTEETLSAVSEAAHRGCRRILALAAGGRLVSLAEEKRWAFVRLPGGLMPRASLGFSFGVVMLTLADWGVSGNNAMELAEQVSSLLADSASLLAARGPHLDRLCPSGENLAKQTATALAGRVVVVLGSTGTTDVIATRFKTQLCENAKALAFANAFPEVTHNEIVGLAAFADAADRLAVLILSSDDDHPGAATRQEAMARILQAQGIPVASLRAEGCNRLERMLSLVQLGDFISYHLAILTDHDPTPIAAIEALKRSLPR